MSLLMMKNYLFLALTDSAIVLSMFQLFIVVFVSLMDGESMQVSIVWYIYIAIGDERVWTPNLPV
jgi:hypothetical protein